MLTRNRYLKYKQSDIVSTKNEPLPNRYPDMYEVYKKFESLYGRDNFILTNGCENAFRIALLATKTRKILLENPTWQLAELICDSFDIEIERINYHYSNNTKTFYIDNKELESHKNVDAIYITNRFNNLFQHDDVNNLSKWAWNIIDETYTADHLINSKKVKSNEIVIGSFSKFVDPGMRLGYILFPETMFNKFNALREEYISREAANYILNASGKIEYRNNNVEIENKICEHSTYVTLEEEPITDLPYKKFFVDDKKFFRIGYCEDLAKYVKY